MGLTVGPPLADSMQKAFGADKVAIQGVDYAADVAGAGTGALAPQDADGAKAMVALVMKVASSCPSSKVVLSGYSQGAEQVRGALMDMPVGGAGIKMVAVCFLSFPASPLFSFPYLISYLFLRFLALHCHASSPLIDLSHVFPRLRLDGVLIVFVWVVCRYIWRSAQEGQLCQY